MDPKIRIEPYKDHLKEIRPRVQSCNTTIFNNAFDRGESTVAFYYRGSVLEPKKFLQLLSKETKKKLKPKQIGFLSDWMEKIFKIGKSCMQIYSFPIEIFSKYVYPSRAYGNIHDQSDLILNYQSYTKEKPWEDTFKFQVEKQMRIMDLCYSKFGYQDGVRFFQMTNIPIDKLEIFISDLSKELQKSQDLNDWFVEYIDIPEQKEKKSKPTQRILSYRSKKLFEDTPDKQDREEIVELIVEGDRKGKKEKELIILPKSPSFSAKIDFSMKKVDELKQLAKSKKIKGYSKMKKAELIQALKDLS
jgi:hypothetical protein